RRRAATRAGEGPPALMLANLAYPRYVAAKRTKANAATAAPFEWGARPENPSEAEGPYAAVEALLALTNAVVTAHCDGRILVRQVTAEHLGRPWELCRLDPAAIALAFLEGNLLVASGSAVVHVKTRGDVATVLELPASIAAFTA